MKNKYILSSLLLGILFWSCDKDDENLVQPVADFDYSVDVGTVTFTNKSQDADVYAWEFGDQSNGFSNLENPAYTYEKAGTYTVEVTLYAGNGYTGINNNISKTVSLVDVPASIAIDGNLDDWDGVPYIADVVGFGTLQKIKAVSSTNYINVYLEGPNIDFAIMQLWIDTDNNPTSGYINNDWWAIGGSGVNILAEGPDFYKYTGADNASEWSWEWQADPGEFKIISDIITLSDDLMAVEFAISKAQLQKFAQLSPDGVNLAITDLNGGWSKVGQIPEFGTGQKFIHVAF